MYTTNLHDPVILQGETERNESFRELERERESKKIQIEGTMNKRKTGSLLPYYRIRRRRVSATTKISEKTKQQDESYEEADSSRGIKSLYWCNTIKFYSYPLLAYTTVI
mmetsp:Transcript_12989/g.24410  ORF Transcript_12989/g.24410 Transcript_12989/m.24410 type:complete len:109 (-) Transcript_12989:116-442(-)